MPLSLSLSLISVHGLCWIKFGKIFNFIRIPLIQKFLTQGFDRLDREVIFKYLWNMENVALSSYCLIFIVRSTH